MADDSLKRRYRNISGTILVINDLNYLEIGINEVIDLSLFSDELLDKTRGLRYHIALKNLIPDESNVKAKSIDNNYMNNSINEDTIRKVATEIIKEMPQNNQQINIDLNIIRTIAEEIGKEIANSMKIQNNTVDNNEPFKVEYNNEYEDNITNSSIEKMQEALAKKYVSVKQNNNHVDEESFDEENNLEDLKNLLNKKEGP